MEDQDLERLLKSAGPREKPPADVEHHVRERLHADWIAMLGEGRARRRLRTQFALAAGILAAAVGLWLAGPRMAGPPEAVGTVASASGEIRERTGWLSGWRVLEGGDVVVAGRTLETGAEGRAALALAGGLSARLDHGTRVALLESGKLRLDRGALYVDSGADARRAAALEVQTDAGSVRHVGTQYEVRVLDRGIELRIREGRVEWRSTGGGVELGHAGEQLVISDDGRVSREAASAYGEGWDWAAAAAPAIDIEGLPLTRFLAWAGRELGRDVEYAQSLSEAELAAIVVHGSTAGLTPIEALHAVLSTTSVQAMVVDGRIVVERRPAN
jgi:ferric-dicitrate binding protein FerR (iron transport regulator)